LLDQDAVELIMGGCDDSTVYTNHSNENSFLGELENNCNRNAQSFEFNTLKKEASPTKDKAHSANQQEKKDHADVNE
jgi:hypothetical protein